MLRVAVNSADNWPASVQTVSQEGAAVTTVVVAPAAGMVGRGTMSRRMKMRPGAGRPVDFTTLQACPTASGSTSYVVNRV